MEGLSPSLHAPTAALGRIALAFRRLFVLFVALGRTSPVQVPRRAGSAVWGPTAQFLGQPLATGVRLVCISLP